MRPSSCVASLLPQHLHSEIVLNGMATSEAPELIGLAQRTLRDLRLRVAGASGGGPDALREAGYAGATSLFDAFETWLNDRGSEQGGRPCPSISSPRARRNSFSTRDGAGSPSGRSTMRWR